MAFLLFVMSKTVIGELVAAAHCRHAVSEMEALDMAWAKLRAQKPDFSMPDWDALHGAMPEWDVLHRTYEAKS